MLEASIDAFDVLSEEFTIGRLYQLSLLLELAHESQARSDQMAAPEVCRARARLFLRQERLFNLVYDLVENETRAYLTLVGEVQAKVDGGLAHFDFQVACLADRVFHQWSNLKLNLVRWQV